MRYKFEDEDDKPKEPKKKYGRHKPGWGRNFQKNDPYQDDAIYWKLHDLIILRDPMAIFKKKKSDYAGGKDNDGSTERTTD